MEKNISEDIDGSFVICEPMVNSITDSMSIVAIPESMPPAAEEVVDNTVDPTAEPTSQQKNRSNSFNDFVDYQMPTKRIDSIDGLPSYQEVQRQDSMKKFISSDKSTAEERNASLKTLNDDLDKIEDNMKEKVFDLEQYLKELRDENEKLKVELEKNNAFMKQQLKNLQEWQNKNKELADDHKRITDHSKQLSDENLSLKNENLTLKEKVNESESKNRQTIEELNRELESLRLKCSQMGNYEKFDLNSELRAQEMTSGLVDAQLKVDAMMAEIRNRDHTIAAQQQQLQQCHARLQDKDNEISALQREMNEVNHKLDTLDAMKSQLTLFERDFKLEEMSKLAALKEVSELQEEIESLKTAYNELAEKLDKGEPVFQLKEDSERVGKHHRRHRRSERLGRHIPVLNVGAVLKGFKQYNPTSNNA